ncbi:MAG: hypothetical protein RL288_296, partial [Actinomycetota bacterium]
SGKLASRLGFPLVYQVRPPRDYWVDRPEVEEAQALELTGTNRPRI